MGFFEKLREKKKKQEEERWYQRKMLRPITDQEKLQVIQGEELWIEVEYFWNNGDIIDLVKQVTGYLERCADPNKSAVGIYERIIDKKEVEFLRPFREAQTWGEFVDLYRKLTDSKSDFAAAFIAHRKEAFAEWKKEEQDKEDKKKQSKQTKIDKKRDDLEKKQQDIQGWLRSDDEGGV